MEQVAAFGPIGEAGGIDRIQIADRVGGGVDASDQTSATAVIGRRADQIRPVGAAGPGVGRIRSCGDVERETSLDGDDAVRLPLSEDAPHDWVRHAKERDVVNETGHEAVADIPIGVAVIVFPGVRNQRRASAVGIRGDVQSVRPGVVGVHLEAVRQPLAEDDGHAFIVGDFIVIDGPDGAEQRIRPARIDRAGAGLKRRVVVEAAVQVIRM